MKFEPLFLLIISLTTVSSLVETHPAYAGCYPCTRYGRDGVTYVGGIFPGDLRKQLEDLIAQKNVPEAETVFRQFLEKVEITQDISKQAAAHQAVADLYARRKQMDLASSHLTTAKALYQRVGNTQRFMEVERQLQQVQHRQRQLRQRQLHQR